MVICIYANIKTDLFSKGGEDVILNEGHKLPKLETKYLIMCLKS